MKRATFFSMALLLIACSDEPTAPLSAPRISESPSFAALDGSAGPPLTSNSV